MCWIPMWYLSSYMSVNSGKSAYGWGEKQEATEMGFYGRFLWNSMKRTSKRQEILQENGNNKNTYSESRKDS